MRKIWTAIIAVMLFAVLLAGCGAAATPQATETATIAPSPTAPTGTATPTETDTATATATATVEDSGEADASEIADTATQAFKNVKTAHFDMTVEAGVGDLAGLITATGDMQLPDRTHMTMEAAGITIEIITIGTDAYTKVGNQWQKTSAEPPTTDPKDIVANLNIPRTAKRLADENVDGTDCYHLQYNERDIQDNVSGDAVFDVYIAKDTNLVKKMVIVSQSEGDVTAGATITMTFSKYNEPVTIEAPI